MNQLTAEDIRKAVKHLEANQIKPEPCGCIKYPPNEHNVQVVLTCEEHNEPLTKEQLEMASANLKAMGLTTFAKEFVDTQLLGK